MKMFTAAAALEEGVIGLHTPVQDSKTLDFGDNIVQNYDKKSMGLMSFEDAIAHSRNVVAGKVALTLGPTTEQASQVLYNMWTRLGIGEPTGIELGNEAAGIVADPSTTRWQALDLVNRSFGQAVAITPLQLVRAFAAMANGGQLVQPHIYAADDATAEANVQQVLSPALSETLRQLMIHVVDEGPNYAEETKIPGYVVGGKTGTAQIWDNQAGGWLADTYNHTFVGFVGNERPEAIILVRIHDTVPRVPKKWGMSLEMTSNELWKRVALDAISELDLQPLSDAPATDRQSDQHAAATRDRRTACELTPQATRRRCENGRTWLTARTRHSSPPRLTPSRSQRRSEASWCAPEGHRSRGGAVDSRIVEAGNAFFALKGERTDGHVFTIEARTPWCGRARRRALPK